MRKGTQGTSLGGKIQKSPNRTKRDKARRLRQEKYWASLASEVTITYVKPKAQRS